MALPASISGASREQLTEDVEFLLEQGFREDFPDGFDDLDIAGYDAPARLVRLAYGRGNRADPGIEPRDPHEFAACLHVWRRMPPHRQTPAVRDAVGAARNHLAQAGYGFFPSPTQDLVRIMEPGEREALPGVLKAVAERNLERLLPGLRENVVHFRIDFSSVGGDLWVNRIDHVPRDTEIDSAQPPPDGLEQPVMQPDGTLSAMPWNEPEADYWDMLFRVAVDTVCLEHPELFGTDADCSIVLSGLGDSAGDPRTAIVSISFRPLVFEPEREPGSVHDEDGPSP